MSELLTLGRVRLVADDGAESLPGGAQPKRIALLAYLALSSTDGPVRRDSLLALFWPELGEEEGRPALRQALYYLRRIIGEDVFVSAGDEISLRGGALKCDAVEFERLIAAGQVADALALYRGDFFDGFHVDDVASELEDWVARTRARLKRRASTAAWTEADSAVASGELAYSVELARRACDLDPDQEAGWRRLMTLQDRIGDRIGALRTYEDLAARLERELDAKPAPETTELAEQLRKSKTPGTAAPRRVAPAAQAREAESPSSHVPAKRNPRRSTVLAALIGTVAVVGAVSAYLRVSGSNNVPSLIAEGALASRDRLLVADFANLVGDTLLVAGITEAFRVDMAQSPLVQVLSARQVSGALQRMNRSPSAALNDSLAREIAMREGAKAIVTGSVANVGGAFTVNVTLVSAERGDVLASFREAAEDSTRLLAAVDRASERLRRRIGESIGSLRALPPLAQMTTASLPALRKYTEGQRLFLAGQRADAIRLYHEATAIDSGFASAHLGLAMAYGSIAERGRSAEAQRRALDHRDRLPFLERSFTVASYAYSNGDFETAAEEYERVLEQYPHDIRALNNLALIYRDRRQFAAAESLFTRAAAIDSSISNLYFGIHSTQLLQRKFRESRLTLDLIARRFPGNPILLNVSIQDAAAQEDWETAERHAETTIAAARGDTLTLIDPYEALAGLAMTQGRLAEAARLWRTQLALSAAAKSHGRHLFGLVQLARLELRHRGSTARALALVDSALAATPLDSVLPDDRLYDEIARFYAVAGRLTRARELLAAAEANDSVLARTPGPERVWTRGVISLAENRLGNAESELRQAADALPCPICALPDLGRAYEANGKIGAAVGVYERYLEATWLFRYESDAVELGWVLNRLAELHDQRGETAKAAEKRGRLLQLWRRADPELQPIISAARAKLPS